MEQPRFLTLAGAGAQRVTRQPARHAACSGSGIGRAAAPVLPDGLAWADDRNWRR